MKLGLYLKLEVYNTLLTDPTLVANEWKGKCENHQ